MRITVADLEDIDDPLSSIHVDLLAGFEDDTATVLYVPLPASMLPRQADNSIVELPAWALTNRLTVIGVHPSRVDDVTDDTLDDIARRVSDAPLYLLEHDADGAPRLRHRRGDAVDDLDEDGVVGALRQADVRAVLKRGGGHLGANAVLHYQGPNGHHYGAFLRPGFALTTVSALDRVAFWLLPMLRDRTNVIVDHWSMLATGHHVVRYAQRFFASVDDVHVDALRGYDETVNLLTARLRRAFPEPTDGKAIFLLSVNSSGHMALDVVLPALDAADQQGAIVAALAAAPPGSVGEVPALAELDDSYRRHDVDDCPQCEVGKIAVPVDRDTYLLKLAAYTQREAITMHDAERSKDVVEAYAGLGVFSVHREHLDGRHHAFYVDIMPMLGTERFRSRLDTCMETLTGVQPQVILHPPSEQAAVLANMVAERLGLDGEAVLSVTERGLRSLPAAQRRRVVDATDVLLVDDVVITGTRIEGYRQQLIVLRREAGGSGEVTLGCLVGMARARDARALMGSKDFVHHRDGENETFQAVERLDLPNWGKRQCPWCRELEVLDGLPEEISALPFVRARKEVLRSRDGLTEVFTPWGSNRLAGEPSPGTAITEEEWKSAGRDEVVSNEYGGRFWDLNPGSVFGDIQGTDLVMSVAAAVHRLRAKTKEDGRTRIEPRLDLRFSSPVSRILDPDLYLLGRYYEPVLVAAILRVCTAWDVRSPDGDEQFAEAITRHVDYLASGERLAGELLVMAALGHIPATSVATVAGRCDETHRPIAEALQAAARRVDGT